MPDIYDFPLSWYQYIVSQKFNLRSLNQIAPTNWNNAGNAISGPHSQLWLTEISFAPLQDPIFQDVESFFTRLRGQSGLMRLSNALRPMPWHDRNLVPTTATFSDGSLFTDNTGFANGYFPPQIYIQTAASSGANFIVLGGLPASTVQALRSGDMLQIMPSGVPGTVPHLYRVMYGGDTNSSGQIGLAIEPKLRAGVAVGDVVSLRYPSTIFRLKDDTQFDSSISGDGQIGTMGGSLIEALDLIP